MDAVAAATAGLVRQYPLDEVPTSPQYPYGSYSATLARGDVYGLTGVEGIRWGQVVSQHFARTTSAALDAAEAFRAAIVGKSLAITGYSTTPCTQDFDPAVVRYVCDWRCAQVNLGHVTFPKLVQLLPVTA